MRSGRVPAAAAIAVLAATMLACSSANDRPATTTTTGAAVPLAGHDDSVTRLTFARCDRARACGYVGAEGSYADDEACKRELGRDVRVRLRAEVCPAGVIDAGALTTCLEEVRRAPCAAVYDELESVAACRHDRLCGAR